MGDHRTWIIVTGVVLCAAFGAAQQRADGSIRLQFPDGVDLTGLSIRYFLTGPFGGFGSDVRTRADIREYDLPTSREGRSARTIKAIVYCPGHQIVLFERDATNGPAALVPIRLDPLGSLRLSGRVIGIENPQRFTIDVTYAAFWSHAYFGIIDGMVASFTVASITLATDGSFVAQVPNFAKDPVIAAQASDERGAFSLIAREGDTNVRYRLELAGRQSTRLPIAEAYPDLVLLALPM